MTESTVQKFIRTLITSLTGTTTIWSHQNASRPSGAYIALTLSGERSRGNEVRHRSDGTGILDAVAYREATLSVNAFGSGAIALCNGIWLSLQKPTVVAKCVAANVAFVRQEGVKDLTELLDGRNWEERANLDLIITYTSSTADEPGYVTSVTITGTLTSTDTTTTKETDAATTTASVTVTTKN